MTSKDSRFYLLVSIEPGKEKDFANETVSKGVTRGSYIEKIDFVHGPFDFIIILRGISEDIDRRIMEIRLLPYVQRTETLIPFENLLMEINHTWLDSP